MEGSPSLFSWEGEGGPVSTSLSSFESRLVRIQMMKKKGTAILQAKMSSFSIVFLNKSMRSFLLESHFVRDFLTTERIYRYFRGFVTLKLYGML